MKRFLVFVGLFACASFGLLSSHDYTASTLQCIPEVIWAPATGGGTWVTSLQITGRSATTSLNAYFMYGGGNYRYLASWAVNLDPGESYYFPNILSTLDAYDLEAFTYYGRVGALLISGNSGTIQITARTTNGNYGKTMQGLSWDACYKFGSGNAAVFNVANSATYRTFVGFMNWSASPITVRFYVTTGNYTYVGSYFDRVFAGWDFQAFNPFDQAGVSYPAYSYPDNMLIWMSVVSGTGQLVGFGSSANNYTNDSAAHLLVQW